MSSDKTWAKNLARARNFQLDKCTTIYKNCEKQSKRFKMIFGYSKTEKKSRKGHLILI